MAITIEFMKEDIGDFIIIEKKDLKEKVLELVDQMLEGKVEYFYISQG